jgi:bacillithiol biosynthesis cysteine-adding enzyme BshC
MAKLVDDYLDGAPALAPFFAHAPATPLHSLSPAALADAGLCDAINAMQQTLGGNGRIEPGDWTIVTGQQPGLLTGPLYSIYKAATAIRLAEETSAASGHRCVPVFWVAGDDHDFEEVRAAHLLTKQHDLRTLTYAPVADVTAVPMHRMPLEDSLHALIDEAAAITTGSEFRAEVTAFLHDSLNAAASFSDWFARVLARLFRDTPLVIFSPDLPDARRVAAPVFARELAEPLASTRALNAAGARLQALGYPPQIVKADEECSFFLEIDARRRKVLWRDDTFFLPELGWEQSPEALAALLDDAPEAFSANVVLRGVVQQVLFPNTLAYIGGPGELAYWAQLRGVFDHFAQPMPVVLPRARALLTTRKLEKLRTKYGLTPDALQAPLDSLLDQVLARVAQSPALDVLRPRQAALEAEAAALLADLARVPLPDSSVLGVAQAFHEQVQSGLARLDRALRRGDAAQVETVRQQLDRLAQALAPQRKPQERVLSLFSFLFEHGWDLVPRIVATLDPHARHVQEIEL